MNRTVIIVVLLVVLLGGFFLVQSQKKSSQTAPSPTTMMSEPTSSNIQPTNAAEEKSETTPDEALKELTVTGKNFSFSPSTMTVNKGDTVKITFKNTGGFHDFRIDEFNVATKQLQDGQEEVVEFTADKTGTFEYYCSVGNHRAMGMKGTLTVN